MEAWVDFWEWTNRLSAVIGILGPVIAVAGFLYTRFVRRPRAELPDEDGEQAAPVEATDPPTAVNTVASPPTVDSLPRGLRLIEYTPGKVLHIRSIKNPPAWNTWQVVTFIFYVGLGLVWLLGASMPKSGSAILMAFSYVFVVVFIAWPVATARLRYGLSVRIRIDKTEVWVFESFACAGGHWPPDVKSIRTFDQFRNQHVLEIYVSGVCVWEERSENAGANYSKTRRFRALLDSIKAIPAKPRTFTWLNPWG